jgi:hypothetical protein
LNATKSFLAKHCSMTMVTIVVRFLKAINLKKFKTNSLF